MLGELELLAEASDQFVNKRFTVVCDDIPRHTISKNDVCSDKGVFGNNNFLGKKSCLR